jgi:DNA-directed RNA polymerase specialized sigma24 family protein
MSFRAGNRPDERDSGFREFARRLGAPLHRSAYLLCGDWHLAEDLVQETFAKAYAHWRRAQHADSPEAYVRRILVNEARQRWRRHEPPGAARRRSRQGAAGARRGRVCGAPR